MVLTDDTIAVALNRIADGVEENNILLERVASHYDSIVPVMKRNAVRSEDMSKAQEEGFAQGFKNIFRPQEN